MDNLELNPSEFYYAYNDLKLSIESLEDVKELLNSLSNLNVDVSMFTSKLAYINNELNILYERLETIKSEMVKMDSNIQGLFNYLETGSDELQEINHFDDIKPEEELDKVKGNNEGLGGKRSTSSKSLLRKPGKLLNMLKGSNKGLGGQISNDASSILLGGI